LFPAGPHSTGRKRRRIIKNSFVDDGNLELAAGIKAIQAVFPASMVHTLPAMLRPVLSQQIFHHAGDIAGLRVPA
jgi:hypothetical protein